MKAFIITDENVLSNLDKPCTDQYQTCADFAKNDYCTKFPDLMRIQCRRACKFCSKFGVGVVCLFVFFCHYVLPLHKK